jgi:hypothetical protein
LGEKGFKVIGIRMTGECKGMLLKVLNKNTTTELIFLESSGVVIQFSKTLPDKVGNKLKQDAVE